eukprot:TRINITY_DN9957_c0_g1_i1.p1 TRINITY_DN9957_c0_g1~~TRINITY_DN9957_c0_g1_i1.p1  ORF type:complete len:279 (+),score=68.84 TRINITY_DN9957_c0_g1_i1:548-1384(+)
MASAIHRRKKAAAARGIPGMAVLLMMLAMVTGAAWAAAASSLAAFAGVAAPSRREAQIRLAAQGTVAATASEQEALQKREEQKKFQLDAVAKAAKEESLTSRETKQNIGKFWVNQPGQISFEVAFDEGDKVRDLKSVIEKVTGIPPDKQILRFSGTEMRVDKQLLEACVLNDVWVEDDRDDSEIRGEYNPDPEEAEEGAGAAKIGIYLFSFVLFLFWITQVFGVNPYANWPEGPREDWSKKPEGYRPGDMPPTPDWSKLAEGGRGLFPGIPKGPGGKL